MHRHVPNTKITACYTRQKCRRRTYSARLDVRPPRLLDVFRPRIKDSHSSPDHVWSVFDSDFHLELAQMLDATRTFFELITDDAHIFIR